jgi:hypothetical protein
MELQRIVKEKHDDGIPRKFASLTTLRLPTLTQNTGRVAQPKDEEEDQTKTAADPGL